MRISMISETNKINQIVKSQELLLNGHTSDISDWLDRSDKVSMEYRAKALEEINIGNKTKKDKFCNIVVRAYDSPDAVRENIGGTAILNFASSKHPGGGFLTGAMAQEESLCYRSNLYDVLSKHDKFYEYNREHLGKSVYIDGIIYSSDVCFFRDSKLNNCEPYYLHVITCPAPNYKAARRNGILDSVIQSTMKRRIEQILKVAIEHNVEHLVLGAFGCGVFGNNPSNVAKQMYELIVDQGYGWYFKQITFAMHDSTSENTKAFSNWFIKKWNIDKKDRGL